MRSLSDGTGTNRDDNASTLTKDRDGSAQSNSNIHENDLSELLLFRPGFSNINSDEGKKKNVQ